MGQVTRVGVEEELMMNQGKLLNLYGEGTGLEPAEPFG
jgi:hypothetical protein